ncbi:hypothetical protein NIES2104_49550 [Leptolyngbya sp. NIES-2104]|nr:hypothetical protein NIES2104_49550 [Leptolyngbya sp. NIES-2104]
MISLLTSLLTRPGMEFGADKQRSARNHQIYNQQKEAIQTGLPLIV